VSAKNEDKDRKWMWGFLAVLAALQFYAVRELIMAFAMFTAAFAAIGAIVACVYLAPMAWNFAMLRVAPSTAGVDMTDAVKARVR
jgi:hypothetical protein